MNKIAMVLSSVFIAAIMFLIVVDVFLRNVFNHPIFGSVEMVQLMMSIVFGFGLAYSAIKKRHVRIDLITAHISHPIRRALDILAYLAAFCFCGLLMWFTFQRGRIYLGTGETVSEVFPVPVYPFVFIITFGMALLALVFLKDLVESIEGTIRK